MVGWWVIGCRLSDIGGFGTLAVWQARCGGRGVIVPRGPREVSSRRD